MARRQRDEFGPGIGEEAAETPNVLSPIVGISREDVLSAIGSIIGGPVRQPFTFVQHIGSFGRNMVDIVGGQQKFSPEPKDRRFVDPAWQKSPVYRRLMQGWLAFRTEMHGFIQSLELDPIEHGRARGNRR